MSKIRTASEKWYERYSRAVNRIFYGKTQKERFLLLMKYTLCFLIAFFLSKTTLPYTEKSVGMPLVDAFLCSCTGGSIFVYAGAVYGLATSSAVTFSRVFTLSAVTLLRISVSLWTDVGETGRGRALNRSPLVKIGYASCMALLQCLFHITEGVYAGIWLNLLATVLALPLLTLAFSFFFAGYPERTVQDGKLFERALYEVSAVLFFMAIVFSLKSTRYFGISLSSLAALLLIYFSASKGGALRGAAVGAVLGWVQSPALLLSYTAVGGSAGVFYCLGILPAAGVSAFVGACVAVFQVGFVSLVSFIPETVMAVALASPMIRYSFLPERFPYPKGELPAEYNGVVEAEKRAITNVKKQEGLIKLSEALREISDVIDGGAFEESSAKAEICSRLTNGFCDSCALNLICWESEKEKTERSVWGILKAVKNGEAQHLKKDGDFLSGYCVKYKGLLDEIKEISPCLAEPCTVSKVKSTESDELEAVADMLLDLSEEINVENSRNELIEKAVRSTAGAIGFSPKAISVLGSERKHIYAYGVSENMTSEESERVRKAFSEACKTEYSAAIFEPTFECMVFSPEKSLSANASFVKQTKTGESCSGDSVFAFETEKGYFYALLADGMGSGEEAKRVSSSALKILEKLLSCGVKKRKAAMLIDSVLRKRREECFTTLDILEIDLVGGGASFLKNGAAASFVVRNGAVYSINAQSMPIGITSGADPEEKAFNLREGDAVIMLSDGVLSDENGEKIISEIICGGFTSIDELAKRIMKKATESEGQSDDKTVMVIGIDAYRESEAKKEA